MTTTDDPDRLLTREEVADLFRVDVQTVTRWVAVGKFPKGSVIKTPGGQARFKETAIRKLLDGESE